MAERVPWPPVVIVTGTGTGVGKTVVTAALTAMLRSLGLTVAVVKPLQTGVSAEDDGDIQDVRRLLGRDEGVTVHEFVRLREPLAPETAARLAGVALPPVAEHAAAVARLAATADVVVVEGAGGLLVRLDSRGGTLADVGMALRSSGVDARYVIVASPALGTLNHTALTAEALASRGLPSLGVIIGSYPREPGLAERTNLEDLPAVARCPLVGVLPEGAGRLSPEDFGRGALEWFDVEALPVSASSRRSAAGTS